MVFEECVKCNRPITRSERGGRPSRFCSTGCKTSSEAEMRRINANLRALELKRAAMVFGPDAEATRRTFDPSIAELQARYDHLAGVPQRDEDKS